MKTRLRGILQAALLVGWAAFLLLRPQRAAQAVAEGLALCAGAVLPALFPFFVCTGMLNALGLTQRFANAVCAAPARLLGVSRDGAAVWAAGLLGGYPAGAQSAAEGYREERLSAAEAAHLARIANNAGPGFVFSMAGAGIFGSPGAGLALWLCQLMSAVLLGVLLRGSAPRPQCAAAKQADAKPLPFSAALTRAVKNAGSVSLSVCMMVVTFRVLCGALDTVLPAETPTALRIILSGVLELSGGTALLAHAALPRVGAFALCSFLLAFGGVGVAAQVASVMQDAGLRVHGYLRAKLLQGTLAAILSLPAGLFLFADRQDAARLTALYAAAGTICIIFRKVMTGNLRAKRV